MDELKPCPFCGSPAEIDMSRTKVKRIGRTKSLSEAKLMVEEAKKELNVVNASCYYRDLEHHWRAWKEIQLFLPRCTIPSCICRTSKSFESLEAAKDAWNRRIPK